METGRRHSQLADKTDAIGVKKKMVPQGPSLGVAFIGSGQYDSLRVFTTLEET